MCVCVVCVRERDLWGGMSTLQCVVVKDNLQESFSLLLCVLGSKLGCQALVASIFPNEPSPQLRGKFTEYIEGAQN